MTYEPSNLFPSTHTPYTQIQTTNGKFVDITCAGTIDISPSIHLNKYLLIRSLTYKLVSVSQLTKELNWTVLMTFDGCIVQDALSRTIIRRSIERGVLYYVGKPTLQSEAMLAHGSSEHQLRMWHRRLGHSSLAYLKYLFPSIKPMVLSWDYESCVLAKSHKHSYLPSCTSTTSPFLLRRSNVWGSSPIFFS